MIIKRKPAIPSSEITAARHYFNRREFLGAGAAAFVALGCGEEVAGDSRILAQPQEVGGRARFVGRTSELDEALTPYEDVTTYNNFYEFGTGKGDPVRNSGEFQPRPWTLRVDGLVDRPGDYQLEDFLKPMAVEDRIYRHRCVEAWSMVVPWRGIPLATIVDAVSPLGSAAYVRFETIVRPEEMPGQRRPILDWPYVEGLRLDEARHPLTLMVTGVYGEDLPNQNGAPLRLIVPWKYGFKGVKSIVRMTFTEDEPLNTWQVQNSREYGFFANVNPTVDHPRWSQARERRIGELRRRPTLMFNGYADEVQSLYAGMDLSVHY